MLTQGPLTRGRETQFRVVSVNSGDIVVMDNLRAHKVAGIRVWIEARGAQRIYLRPHSPALSPLSSAGQSSRCDCGPPRLARTTPLTPP
jgi:transposase